MKRFFIVFALLSMVVIGGCGAKYNDFVSEITNTYLYGKTEGMECSISIGEREKAYSIDGFHTENCEFSLIVLKVQNPVFTQVQARVSIDNEIQEVQFEINPYNGYYMADLGYAIDGESQVLISYQNENLALKNLSKQFLISSDDALKIGYSVLDKNIEKYNSSSGVQGECYLKILEKEESSVLYWVYTFVAKDGSTYNILINVNDKNELIY